MGERVTGELSGRDFRLQSGLHRGEIVDVAEHAAIALSALFDDVLPEAADQRARRIIEGGAEIGEGRRRAAACSATSATAITAARSSATTRSAVTWIRRHCSRLRRRDHVRIATAVRLEV